MRESWIFDPPREELDILPSIFSTQSVSLIVRCVATSVVFVSGAGGVRISLLSIGLASTFNRWRTLPFSCWIPCGISIKLVKMHI